MMIFDDYITIMKSKLDNFNKTSIISASYDITSNCNLSCEHCYNKDVEVFKDEKSIDFKKMVVKQLYKLGVIDFVISGGEPFIDKDILSIVKYAKDLDMRVTILSNGLLITPKIAKELSLIFKKNDIVQISIDGSINIEYDNQRKLTREEKLTVIDNLKLLLKFGLNVVINITPTTINQNDIINIIRELIPIGIRNISATSFAPFGRNAEELIPDYIHLNRVHNYVKILAEEYNLNYYGGIDGHPCESYEEFLLEVYPKKNENIRKCEAARFNIHVNSIGEIYPCVFMTDREFKICDIEKESIDIINFIKKTQDRLNCQTPKLCTSCKIFEFCGGGCIGLIYEKYKNLNEVDPRCRWR